MSPAQRVLARASQTRPRVPSLAPSQSPRGLRPGRRAVDQGRRSRSGYLRILGQLSGTRPRFCHPGCQRSCLKSSRDGEAYWTIIYCGTQRRPFGRVYLRVTPKAETPCAHGALVRECHRRDVKCSLASRIWAEQQCPIPCTAVRVWEVAAPDAADRLEWLLLCDAEVVDFAQARECALQYSTRWVIEEYHKAIKTGLGAERLQLESAERLFAAVAIMSVVALRLIELRERLRRHPDAEAAQSGLVLSNWRYCARSQAARSVLYARWPWPSGAWVGISIGPEMACRDGKRSGMG